jgi:protein-L-isoaspartate(D-aspartate) O-methyltransferase
MCRAGRLRSPAVEEAFRAVPRHLFLPDVPVERAYADEAVAVQVVDGVATSSASQPSMMAIMLEQLDIRPGHRVLEIGAGTGYNAALMAHLVGPGGTVTAVDIDAELVADAARNLRVAGVAGVALHCADGALGLPARAPYDRIVLTVGSSDVRPEWVRQLAPGGRLLLPLAVRGSQLSVALDLGSDGVLRSDSVRSCAFIRLRGIGAGPDTAVPLVVGTATLQLVADPGPAHEPVDAAAVAAALTAPGPVRSLAGRLGPADVWDGFGLWLALREPSTVRLLAPDTEAPDAPVREWLPIGPGGAALGVSGGDGLALVDAERGAWARFAHGDRRAAVRAFGGSAAGTALAQRVAGYFAEWVARGRPDAARIRMTVVPHGVPAPPAPAGAVVVPKAQNVLVVDWAGPQPPRGGS